MAARPRPVLDVGPYMHEYVIPPLVALPAPRHVAPIVAEQFTPRAQPSGETLQERLVQLGAGVAHAEVVSTPGEVCKRNTGVGIEYGA